MNGLSPKTAEKDTTLTVNGQTYSIRKGEVVFITMASVHKNREIYDDPYEFRLKRFIHMHDKSGSEYKSQKVYTKEGVQVRNPYIWWGGGLHIVRLSVKRTLTSSSVPVENLRSRRLYYSPLRYCNYLRLHQLKGRVHPSSQRVRPSVDMAVVLSFLVVLGS